MMDEMMPYEKGYYKIYGKKYCDMIYDISYILFL